MPTCPDLAVQLDEEFIVEGFEAFTQTAQEFYNEYSNELLGIMRLFGIKTEVWCFHKIERKEGKNRGERERE